MFTLGIWASYALNPTDGNYSKETDLYLSITPFNILSFTFTEYFCVLNENNPSYLKYSEDETAHVFESMVTISFKYLGLNGAYNF